MEFCFGYYQILLKWRVRVLVMKALSHWVNSHSYLETSSDQYMTVLDFVKMLCSSRVFLAVLKLSKWSTNHFSLPVWKVSQYYEDMKNPNERTLFWRNPPKRAWPSISKWVSFCSTFIKWPQASCQYIWAL